MKNIALLSILFFSLLTNIEKNDYISIEYVGAADKPMPVVYISKKPIHRSEQVVTIPYDDLPENYVVDNSEFLFIKGVVNSTPRKTFEMRNDNGFIIRIRENGSIDSCFITRKNSNSLFLKTIFYLNHNKKNEDLISRLDFLRRRNVFDDNGTHLFPK